MFREDLAGYKIVLGIDPGKSGGIACLDLYLRIYDVIEMPKSDLNLIMQLNWLYNHNYAIMAFIELQHAFPKQGVVSTFNFGKHYGTLVGILKAIGYAMEEVSPKSWKRFFELSDKADKTKKRTEIKNKSIEKAIELFPDLKSKIGKHDGKAEALLIAEYGRRKLMNIFASKR